MWWDSNTGTAYGAVMSTTVEEPASQSPNAQLQLQSEILAFEVFPFCEKTGDNIKAWFLQVLLDHELSHSMVSGVTPDGAADGQCALKNIDTLAEKVDTCMLHILQRGVLISIGLAGKVSKNEGAKAQLRLNGNIVTLSNQSGVFLKTIKQKQIDAGVKPFEVMSLVRTCPTRWSNQYLQLERNDILKQSVEPSLQDYKKVNKGLKEAIVLPNISDQGSKVGQAVAAAEIGMNAEQWDVNLEMEAFLCYPHSIKDTIEHKLYCTGAQGMMLLFDLKHKYCDPAATLRIKEFPKSLSVNDRSNRKEVTTQPDDLDPMITKARSIMREEIEARTFKLRPSNGRLILCYMSKQGVPASAYLTKPQVLSANHEHALHCTHACSSLNVCASCGCSSIWRTPSTSLRCALPLRSLRCQRPSRPRAPPRSSASVFLLVTRLSPPTAPQHRLSMTTRTPTILSWRR
jgi:hypothetical protein